MLSRKVSLRQGTVVPLTAIVLVAYLIQGVAADSNSSVPPQSTSHAAGSQVPAPANAASEAGTQGSYPLGNLSRWFPNLQSFRLRGELTVEKSPEQIAQQMRLLSIKFPDAKTFDPLVFRELLPLVRGSLECDLDRTRLRSATEFMTPDGAKLFREVKLWNGARSVFHYQNFFTSQDCFLIKSRFDWNEAVLSWPIYVCKQPPQIWTNNAGEAQQRFERDLGLPVDFVLVGREVFHEVDCYVLMNSAGNQSDRFYVGVKDNRWHGAKQGIVELPDVLREKQDYKLAIEEFLGKKLEAELSMVQWAAIETSLRALTTEKKTAWCRLLYSRIVKQYVPVLEYWFSDFHNLGGGREFPYQQTIVTYSHLGPKISVNNTCALKVSAISLDEPVEDRIFQEDFIEGADVVDETHDRPLRYQHKATFTADEWQNILQEANDRHLVTRAARQRIQSTIGQIAPPLPTGEWINSVPLTWETLRGKIVLLQFSSLHSEDSLSALAFLSRPALTNQSPANDAKALLVVIGVQSAGPSSKDVKSVVEARQLHMPICIDRRVFGDNSLGQFYGACEVDRLDTTIAVDEQGRILDHGPFNAVFAKALRYRNELIKKERSEK